MQNKKNRMSALRSAVGEAIALGPRATPTAVRFKSLCEENPVFTTIRNALTVVKTGDKNFSIYSESNLNCLPSGIIMSSVITVTKNSSVVYFHIYEIAAGHNVWITPRIP